MKKIFKKLILLFFFFVFTLSGITQDAKKQTRYQPSLNGKSQQIIHPEFSNPYPWPVSTPEAQGLSSEIFEHAFKVAERMPYFYSLLITRNGYLIGERYFHFYTQHDSQAIHSVSKSILSALVGIAIERKFIQSVNQKIMDFFPEYTAILADPRFLDITIQQLLTMTAGLPANESSPGIRNPYELQMLASTNPVEFIFEHPLDYNPGEEYHYSNAGTHLLSVIITRATGMSTKGFADRYLFEPLKISVRDWKQDSQGYYYGGFRMYFVPRDLARFGQLYLRNGYIDDQQIVPEQWVRDSIHFHVQGDFFGYGYLWRLYRIFNYDCYFAWGYGGQFILNIPGLDMTIVAIVDPSPVRLDAGLNSDRVFKFMVQQLLFPIYSSLGDPPYSPMEAQAYTYENRSLIQFQYINFLTWRPNPQNGAVNIRRYKIYQLAHRIYDLTNDEWQLLGEVDAGSFEFRHFNTEKDRIYYYAVTAVTDDNKESIAAATSTQYPLKNK